MGPMLRAEGLWKMTFTESDMRLILSLPNARPQWCRTQSVRMQTEPTNRHPLQAACWAICSFAVFRCPLIHLDGDILGELAMTPLLVQREGGVFRFVRLP